MNYRIKATGEYPVSKTELIARNPSVSFPDEWDASTLDYLGVDYVVAVAKPEITATQRLVEGRPVQDGERWLQTWNVVNLSPEEISSLTESAKTAKLNQINSLCDQALQAGYGFEYEDASHVLQTRGLDDKTNWLGVLSACQVFIADGKGDGRIDIRTQANEILSIPASQLLQILFGAMVKQSDIWANSWKHKDAVRALVSLDEINAYDVTTGWE